MMQSGRRLLLSGASAVAVLAVTICTGLADPNTPPQVKVERRNYIDRLTAEFQLETADDAKVPLKRCEKSLLQWSWLRNGFTDGQTYIWASRGRPRVIGSAFLIPAERLAYYEFVSIAPEPLTCRHNDEAVWTPPAVELAWWDVPDSPALAETPRARLSQLRGVGRQFHGVARMGPPRYEPGSRWELDLLTTPLYQYSDPDQGIAAGAVFVMAMGTDPQLVMLIEARVEQGKTIWKAAFTRLSGFELAASFGEKEIWTSPKVENGHAKNSTWHLSQPIDASGLFSNEAPGGAPQKREK